MGINLGLRGGDEHRQLEFAKHLILEKTSDGEVLTFHDFGSKTFRGGLDHRRRNKGENVKIFENKYNPDRCPIRLYKLYVSLRPEPCTTSAFYLKPKDWFEGKNWFANAPVGRNTLFSMIKNMMESAGVHGRYTNHSCRKTTGTRMHSAGFSENEIRSITGHSSNAVSEYIEIGEKRKIEISRSLSCSKISPVVKDDSNVKKTEGETEKKMPCVRMTKGDITLENFL